jgi:hypothetical protein
VERELVLSTEVAVVVPIHPVAREIGTVNLEIAQVCFDPRRMGELERWELPAHAQTARFSITTLGLIPEDADPTSPAMIERFGLLRRFVEENLRVFVDVSELAPDGEGRSVRVRWTWRRTWQEASEALTDGNLHEELDVVLLSDAEGAARAAHADGLGLGAQREQVAVMDRVPRPLTLRAVKATDQRLFGTDGIRGRYGEGWLTDGAVSALGRAIGTVLSRKAKRSVDRTGGKALVGYDGRRSGPALEAAIARGLAATGYG